MTIALTKSHRIINYKGKLQRIKWTKNTKIKSALKKILILYFYWRHKHTARPKVTALGELVMGWLPLPLPPPHLRWGQFLFSFGRKIKRLTRQQNSAVLQIVHYLLDPSLHLRWSSTHVQSEPQMLPLCELKNTSLVAFHTNAQH